MLMQTRNTESIYNLQGEEESKMGFMQSDTESIYSLSEKQAPQVVVAQQQNGMTVYFISLIFGL